MRQREQETYSDPNGEACLFLNFTKDDRDN